MLRQARLMHCSLQHKIFLGSDTLPHRFLNHHKQGSDILKSLVYSSRTATPSSCPLQRTKNLRASTQHLRMQSPAPWVQVTAALSVYLFENLLPDSYMLWVCDMG